MFKKYITPLVVIFGLSFLLVGCKTVTGTPNADELTTVIVDEINDDELIVHGTGDNNVLGDEAILRLQNAKIIMNGKKAKINDIQLNDTLEIKIEQVTMSLPPQTNASYVNIIKK